MKDALPRAHELDLAGLEDASVAEAVLVLEGAFDDVGEDFHVAMGMGGEAAAGGDVVLVDDAEAAEAHVRGVVVVGKGEGVAGLEPAVVGVAALGGAADDEGIGGGIHGGGWFGFEDTREERLAGAGRSGKNGAGQKVCDMAAMHETRIA